MDDKHVQRRLAAILAADVVGYSRLMGVDEVGTRDRLNDQLDGVIRPAIQVHRGRLVKTMGDGFLVEFGSVVDAVQCAADVQSGIGARERSEPEDRQLLFRIGIHLGDVIVEGDDIHGDGVNIAARLEGLAEPGGICVSDMVHSGVRSKLSLGFSDLGEQSLKNIADPVRVFRAVLAPPGKAGATAEEALFRRPAVAVLPFENISGDPEQEYFADGLTEDIITALSLWRTFPVIARHSTFAYKGTSPDIRKVGAELGVRYVIEGSVRKAGNRIRVTAQLINSTNGHHVWADRYDRDLEDIFDLQEELSQHIAATIAPELEFSQASEAKAKTPQSLDAWELVQRGYALIWSLDIDSVVEARAYFERAIEFDPDYARAYAGLAFTYHRQLFLRQTEDSGVLVERMYDAANRAVVLDDSDAGGHVILAMAWFWRGEPDRGLAEGRRAVDLNPNNAHAHQILGTALTLTGRPLEGLGPQLRAMTLSPRDPRHGVWMWTVGLTHLIAHQHEEAVDWSQRAIDRHSGNPDAHLVLASAFGHLGRLADARVALDTYQRLLPLHADDPHLLWRLNRDDDERHFQTGLRKAGLRT